MDNLEHPALIEEWKQSIDDAVYEKNLYKDAKLPSIKKKNDCNDKTEYCPKSINNVSIGHLLLISWGSLQTG